MAEVLENDIGNIVKAEGSSLPPLPYNEATPAEPFYTSNGFIITVVLFVIITLFVGLKFAKRPEQENVTDILSKEPAPSRTGSAKNISSPSRPHPDTIKEKTVLNEDKSTLTTYTTPNNLDRCIKKFLEITKNK